MTWTFTDDLDAYQAAAGAAVAASPVENTLLLTVAEKLRLHGGDAFGADAPLFGWWRGADGAVTGALMWTPPHPVLVGPVPPEAVAPLVEACAEYGNPAVSAERATVDALAAEWRRTGVMATTGVRQRLYRLAELIPPDPTPPGRGRIATAADRELLAGWVDAFRQETGQAAPGALSAVDDRISYGGLAVWEQHEGQAVSMAGTSRPAVGAVRVAPVYTPAEHRGRGYAAAVTALVSRAARDAGAGEVVLFADLANPTSNGVYLRLGYQPVSDRVEISVAGRGAHIPGAHIPGARDAAVTSG